MTAREKTTKINGKDVPLDASEAIVRYVDVVTEDMISDIVVHLGLGALIGSGDGGVEVKGIAHLRMSPNFAKIVAERLIRSADLIESQTKIVRRPAN